MPTTRVTLVGNICSDVMNKKANGTSMTRFRMACDRSIPVVDDNGRTIDYESKDLLFIEVQGWGRLADNMLEAFHNGMGVVVEGKLISYKWTYSDPNTGEERTGTKIVCRAERAGVDMARRGVIPMPTFNEVMGTTKEDLTEEAKRRGRQKVLAELAELDGATAGIYPDARDSDEFADVETLPTDAPGLSVVADEFGVDPEPSEDEDEPELVAA